VAAIKFPKSHPLPSAMINECPHCDELIRGLLDTLYYGDHPLVNPNAYDDLGFVVECDSSEMYEPFTIAVKKCCFIVEMTATDDLLTVISFQCDPDNHPT
jgi:hypothetical protein